MGRARGTAAGRGGGAPTTVTPSFLDSRALLRGEGDLAVGELLELPDGSRMEIQEGDPASLLRGLAQIKSVRFTDGNYEIDFHDGDRALLHISDGRITFASGEESPSKILGAFARGLGARSISSDPLSISNDPETRRLFDQLSELQRKLLEDPYDQDLLREFARVSDQLMQTGILHQGAPGPNGSPALAKSLMPEGIEVNGVGLARRMAGLPEEDRYSMDETTRKNRELQDSVNSFLSDARARIEALGDTGPAAQLAMRSPGFLFFTEGVDPEEIPSVWTSEWFQPRLQAALFASGQIDADGNPTGKYEHLSPYLDGTNPEQTIGIPMSQMYDPDGPNADHPLNEDKIPFTPSQLAAMNIMRLEHRGGKRFFLLRGPASSGKDTLAREFAASNVLTSIPIQLGGRASTGVESAIGVDSLSTQYTGGVPVLDENGEIVMEAAYVRNPDGSLKHDKETGKPIQLFDDQGDPVMVPKIQDETSTTISSTNLGKIGSLADKPVCFIISDPDGHEKEFSRLHAAFGDNVGETEGRFIMVDSSTGEYVDVHPETCFVITTNEVETPENPDGAPKRATQSRACAVDVGSPSEKEESDRLAHLVRKQLNFEHPLAVSHKDFNPELAELDISSEDLATFARMQIKLVAAASKSGMIEETLSARETASMAADYFAACMGGSITQDPVEIVMSRLTRLVRTKGGQRSEGDIRQAIETVIADEKSQLIDMVGPTRDRLRSIEEGKGDPVAKERAEAARAAEEAVEEKEEV